MKKKFYLCILFLVTSLLYSLPYTHYTSDYLRIRNDYNLNSQIITVLEPNMGVELVEKGKKDTIDGITSNWVKVIAANGYVGWCFAGYLKPIEKDVSEILAKEVEKVQSQISQNDLQNNSSINDNTLIIKKIEKNFKCWVNSPEGINLRVLPSLDSEVIKILENKQELVVCEIGNLENIDGKLSFWYKIRIDDVEGWIFSAYTSLYPEEIEIHIEKNLEITYENILGNWFSGYTDIYFPQYISQASFYTSFLPNNRYSSGKNFTNIGVKGTFNIENEIINIKFTENENPNQTVYEKKIKIVRLTDVSLIYEDLSKTEDYVIGDLKVLRRYPKFVLEELKFQTIDSWLSYINKFGNQEFYNGTNLFMFSVVNQQYEVALLLYHSGLPKLKDINISYTDIFAGIDTKDSPILQYLKEVISLSNKNEKINANANINLIKDNIQEKSIGLNDYRYTDYKTSYNELLPSMINENWESFYIFSKDSIAEVQQQALNQNDMYTCIVYDDYKIFTGLYKDKRGNEGYFVVKMDLLEKSVLDMFSETTDNNLIVFLQPWKSSSDNIWVSRKWFTPDEEFYISTDNMSVKLFW